MTFLVVMQYIKRYSIIFVLFLKCMIQKRNVRKKIFTEIVTWKIVTVKSLCTRTRVFDAKVRFRCIRAFWPTEL